MVNLKEGETLPKEVKHLKYLESFGIQSNANFQLPRGSFRRRNL